MITWKCLLKLDNKELIELVNDIKNGNSYTIVGWEDTYPTDCEILEYAASYGLE